MVEQLSVYLCHSLGGEAPSANGGLVSKKAMVNRVVLGRLFSIHFSCLCEIAISTNAPDSYYQELL